MKPKKVKLGVVIIKSDASIEPRIKKLLDGKTVTLKFAESHDPKDVPQSMVSWADALCFATEINGLTLTIQEHKIHH